MNDNLIKFVNEDIEIDFNGEKIKTKKATVKDIIEYSKKVEEIDKENLTPLEKEFKIVSLGVYLILRKAKPELTIEEVENLMPANINPFEIMEKLGFMNPERIEMAKKVQKEMQI